MRCGGGFEGGGKSVAGWKFEGGETSIEREMDKRLGGEGREFVGGHTEVMAEVLPAREIIEALLECRLISENALRS